MPIVSLCSTAREHARNKYRFPRLQRIFGAGGMDCLALSTLPKGPVFIYVGGAGEGKYMLERSKFLKGPPLQTI